ncbi:MAG TPA: hypothetical protein VHA54_10940 [Solirubrobacterales bacterium]|nr:hypothetical protein [Solirubrobacterales bacterium]
MTLFVRNEKGVLGPGGRVRRLWSLADSMLAAAGLAFLADLALAVDLPAPVQYVLCGLGFGAAGAKAAIVRRESRGGEMPPDRVRRFEILGIAIGVAAMALAMAVQVVLPLL